MSRSLSTFWKVLLAGVPLYAAYYLKFVVEKPKLYCDERMRSFLKGNVPILFQNFWPTFFFLEGRVQTVFNDLFSETKNVIYVREMLTFPDGCQVALDWSQKFYVKSEKKGDDDDGDISEDDKKRLIVIIVPSVLATSRDAYVKRVVDECDSRGFRCVVVNYRGHAGVALKSTKLYCAAEWSDLDCAVGWVHQHHPSSPLMAVGCSLGGILLTNYAASHTSNNLKHLSGAMAISICWDFVASHESLERPINFYLLNKTLTKAMIYMVKKYKNIFSEMVDLDVVYKSKYVREFDDNFTSKVFGYKDALEYYADCSARSRLQEIKIPYLSLNAEDDPFSPIESVPTAEASKNANVVIATTTRGGHLGFVDALWRGQKEGYGQRVFGEFASAIFKSGGEIK